VRSGADFMFQPTPQALDLELPAELRDGTENSPTQPARAILALAMFPPPPCARRHNQGQPQLNWCHLHGFQCDALKSKSCTFSPAKPEPDPVFGPPPRIRLISLAKPFRPVCGCMRETFSGRTTACGGKAIRD